MTARTKSHDQTRWTSHWAPLHEDIRKAFCQALQRARQHGHVGGVGMTGEMVDAALFSDLAALRDEGCRIAPEDRFFDYEPGLGWNAAPKA